MVKEIFIVAIMDTDMTLYPLPATYETYQEAAEAVKSLSPGRYQIQKVFEVS